MLSGGGSPIRPRGGCTGPIEGYCVGCELTVSIPLCIIVAVCVGIRTLTLCYPILLGNIPVSFLSHVP